MSESESDKKEAFDQIAAFEAAYDYDASYMRDLYERSTSAFSLFNAVRAMTAFRHDLPAEAHYAAAITVMQMEDCSGCLDLNFKLAREAGVSEEIIAALAGDPDKLPSILQDVRLHTKLCLGTGAVDEEVAARIEKEYGSAAFAELAICIVGVRMYPGIKRALLKMQSCNAGEVK